MGTVFEYNMDSLEPAERTEAASAPAVSRHRPPVSQTPAQIAAALEASRRNLNPSAQDAGEASQQSHLSTMNVLRNFENKTLDAQASERSRKRSKVVDYRKTERKTHRQLLDQLESKRQADAEKPTIWQSLLSSFTPKPAPIPRHTLIGLSHDFFPPRMAIPVHVCDIGERHAASFKTTLGEIEACWKEKPEWAVIRWISSCTDWSRTHSLRMRISFVCQNGKRLIAHMLQSVEDMFLHDWHHGKPFHNSGKPGYPFLEIECLQLQRRCLLQDTRDAFELLKGEESIKTALDDSVLSGDQNESFTQDFKWRANHIGINPGFWESSLCDIPMLLSEGIPMGDAGPIEPVRGRGRIVDSTSIIKHPQFENSRLVTRPFRAFNRSDGCVLSMSSAKGVDYLSRDLAEHLDEPPDELLGDPDASVVGSLMREFEKTGELGVTPHNIKDGRSAVSVLTALQAAAQNMKQRTFEPWDSEKTIELVQDYLVCIDELKTLNMLFSRKIEFFENLKKDVAEHMVAEENEDRYLDSNVEGSRIKRIDWALSLMKYQSKDAEILLNDVLQAMNALFQLCSIRQNKIVITSDRQNKAILIFTGFTIVFLPLSFFTSYYGMNLKGISDTSKTESYFWQVCGSITLVIVCMISLAAFCLRVQMGNILRSGRKVAYNPV